MFLWGGRCCQFIPTRKGNVDGAPTKEKLAVDPDTVETIVVWLNSSALPASVQVPPYETRRSRSSTIAVLVAILAAAAAGEGKEGKVKRHPKPVAPEWRWNF